MAAIERAITRAERTEERWFGAELFRIKGELTLEDGGPDSAEEAERLFVLSRDWARRQEVLSWELRGALSLARLRATQDRPNDARQILAPVYDLFTEGFETTDLRSARTLLASLALAGTRCGS